MAGYGSNAAADTYHAERGNTAWAALLDAAKTVARIRGSVYIDGYYGSRFPGTKTGGRAQERAWPRTSATDRDGASIDALSVPIEVEQAAYEAALIEAVTPGKLNPTLSQLNNVRRTSVGPVEKEFFEPGGLEDLRPMVTIIEELLAPLIYRIVIPVAVA